MSFCADDKGDKRLFAFIAKLDDDKHYCYGLDSLHQVTEIASLSVPYVDLDNLVVMYSKQKCICAFSKLISRKEIAIG